MTNIICLYCNQPFIYNPQSYEDVSCRCVRCYTHYFMKYIDDSHVLYWEVDVKKDIKAIIFPDKGYAIRDNEKIIAKGPQPIIDLTIDQIKHKVNKLLAFL